MTKFYAVKEGRNRGIYKTWEECQKEVIGYKGALYKSFQTYEEAENFIKGISQERKEEYKNYENYAYIDGSYDKENKIYGSGIVLVQKNKKTTHKIAGNKESLIELRNVAGEIEAVKYVLNYAKENNIREITIYYDYAGIENWAIKKWKANLEYTKNYAEFVFELSREIKINFIKVKAHSGITFNEEADRLAKEAIEDFLENKTNINSEKNFLFGDEKDNEEIKTLRDKTYLQESFFD